AAAAVLALVDPDLRAEVRVRPVDARIDHRDGHTGASGRDVPGLRRVDVRVRRAGKPVDRLPGVVQAPRVRVGRIVRDRLRVHNEVRLGVPDARILLQLGERGRDRVGTYVRERAVDLFGRLLLVGADPLVHVLLVRGGNVLAKLVKEFTG